MREDDIAVGSRAGLAGLDRRSASCRERDQGWRAGMYGLCSRSGGRWCKGAYRRTARGGSHVDAREEFMNTRPAISVNERAAKLVARLIADARRAEDRNWPRRARRNTDRFRQHENFGSIAAGLRIAEICTGGLADVRLAPSTSTPRWPWTIAVRSSQPVIACLASQYAGWRLSLTARREFIFCPRLGAGPRAGAARTVVRSVCITPTLPRTPSW